ncbi:hypothetical protein G6O67_008545 [Ophiocordyceps sinensis]|uniref:Uncharacterized protein n=1 Tax=Ophiocordyceps sinensis TaxID=72228 RepID=A0A8H4LS81_9HYPO|nr:hypothetical protein G6O67_008545 [Ophiocordyceps sinensis]
MARALVRILGVFLAVLATSALLCLQVITAAHVDDASLRPVTIVAASLQSVVLIVLLWLAASHVVQTGRVPSTPRLNIIFGFELLASQLLAASSVALALATALQLAAMILHFMSLRELVVGETDSAEVPGQRTRIYRVKSIPYIQTIQTTQTRTGRGQPIPEMASVERPAPLVVAEPSSATKAGFFASPFAQVIRPSSSKTKLRAGERRPSSRESTPRESSVEQTSFDSWDTSSVDTHNRQVVLEMSSSPSVKPRGLETIPASPRPSRSPSPRTPAHLEPPRSVRTRRSYSPSTLRQREDSRLTASSSVDELHIHPPVPIRLPDTGALCHAGHERPGITQCGTRDAQQVDERDEDDEAEPERTSSSSERRMTPPVPAWLLSRGVQSGFDGVQQPVSADVKRTA